MALLQVRSNTATEMSVGTIELLLQHSKYFLIYASQAYTTIL